MAEGRNVLRDVLSAVIWTGPDTEHCAMRPNVHTAGLGRFGIVIDMVVGVSIRFPRCV
jgi:hypothetical protein